MFGTTATAVCYPHRALEVAETSYYHTASSISHLYNSITNSSVVKKVTKKKVDNNISLSEAVKDIEVEETGANMETVSKTVKDTASEDGGDLTTKNISLSEAVKDVKVVAAEPSTEESKNDNITKAQPEYNPNQNELVEITVVPINLNETAAAKDVTLELVDNIVAEGENVVEGDLGQSNPEDQDMYSTRS